MNKPIIILGSGGHASVLFDALQLCNRKILGVVDPFITKEKIIFKKLKFLGDDSEIEKFNPIDIELVNGVGPSTKSYKKQEIEKKYSSLGYTFATVIHPSAIINSQAVIGNGSQIMAGAIIQSRAIIGNSCVINTSAIVEHDCHLKNSVHVGPGAVLCGGVKLNDYVYVGANAVIIQNVKVSEKSIIGAGITLTKNLGPSLTFIGQKI